MPHSCATFTRPWTHEHLLELPETEFVLVVDDGMRTPVDLSKFAKIFAADETIGVVGSSVREYRNGRPLGELHVAADFDLCRNRLVCRKPHRRSVAGSVQFRYCDMVGRFAVMRYEVIEESLNAWRTRRLDDHGWLPFYFDLAFDGRRRWRVAHCAEVVIAQDMDLAMKIDPDAVARAMRSRDVEELFTEKSLFDRHPPTDLTPMVAAV